MRVKVNDRKYLRDLILYLRECGCVAERASAREGGLPARDPFRMRQVVRESAEADVRHELRES